ncbi:hypothetical protein [Rhizobium sp. YTU87027]|uniref:hypothetical protein n=1 Tax=Rhizobium sp. YTU87027 TaxID=3417741 RepID=UPI003D68DA48
MRQIKPEIGQMSSALRNCTANFDLLHGGGCHRLVIFVDQALLDQGLNCGLTGAEEKSCANSAG